MINIVDYPANPTVGQEHTVGTTTKIWDGEKWANKSTGQHERRIDTLEDSVNGVTVAEAINLPNIDKMLGSRVWLTDRQAWFEVVLTATAGLPANGMDLIQSAANTLYSFHLIISYPLSLRALGAKFDSDGTTGNGTDNSDIIQRGDDLVASGMELLFDVKGIGRISKKVNKHQNSVWQSAGAGKPRFSPSEQSGVAIFSDHDGLGIEVYNPNEIYASAWGAIKGITIFGDHFTHPNSVGLGLKEVRWQIVEDVFVHTFNKCITGGSTAASGDGQKLHFIRIHAFNSLTHGCYIYGYDDCWFNDSEFVGNTDNTDGTIALELNNVKSSQLNSSRYQIAETNLLIKNCIRVEINGGIADLAGGIAQESVGDGIVIEDSGSVGIHGTEFYDNNGANIKIRTSGSSGIVGRVTIDGTVHKQDNASSTALEIENNGGAINRVNFDASNDVGDCDNKVIGYDQLGGQCNIGNFITKQRRLNITDGTANVIQPQQYDIVVAIGAITSATTVQFTDNGYKTGQVIKFYDKRTSGGASIQFLNPNGTPISGAFSSASGEVREFYCASATSWESLTTQ